MFSESRAKIRAGSDSDEESDDDIITLRRADHELPDVKEEAQISAMSPSSSEDEVRGVLPIFLLILILVTRFCLFFFC